MHMYVYCMYKHLDTHIQHNYEHSSLHSLNLISSTNHIMYVVMEAGCQPEYDELWGIQWQLTPAGTVAEAQCPDELEGKRQQY